ncbi:sialic acid-binding Ig-like lectin 5 [Glossophaga mutica]
MALDAGAEMLKSCDTETLTLTPEMLLLLLLALLWAGSLAQDPGFQLYVQGSVVVQEGQCVSVPCTVIYPNRGWADSDPAHGYWFWERAKSGKDDPVATNNPHRKLKNQTTGRFHLIGDPRTYNCSLHIRDAQRRDTGRYFFRVERGSYVKQDYKINMLSVNLTHQHLTSTSGGPWNLATPTTLPVQCHGTVTERHHRSSPGGGVHLTPLGPGTTNYSVLTFTPGPQHHGTDLTCQVALPGGEIRERTVQLSVTYLPQLQGPSCSWEDEGLNCSCSSSAQPAPSLHWRLGEGLLEWNPSNASYTVTSSSEGPWANSSLSLRGELTSNLRLGCEAQNTHGKETVTVLLLPGRPGHRTGLIQAAVGGAGAAALLAVCLGLIILGICRKRRAEKAESQEGISQSHLDAPSSPPTTCPQRWPPPPLSRSSITPLSVSTT